MDAPEIIVGLDIGTTKIACLVGRKTDHGKIEILGIGKAPSLGVTRGVVSNIEKTVQSIRAAVDEAESKSGIEIKVVNVGIAGQHIKSLQHRGMITRDSIEEEISQKDVDEFCNVECAIHYTKPLPGKGIHNKTEKLCKIFDIKPNRMIWQNNNGVITLTKDVWNKMQYLDTIKEVYDKAGDFALDICDETMFNFITIYKDIDVTRYKPEFNTLVRNRAEFEQNDGNEFRMFHFTKHTGKEVLNEELRNPTSILY